MPSIYDKPVWRLMWEMVEDIGLEKGEIISKDQVIAWFAARYPKIKKGTITAHLIRMSTNAPSRIHYYGKPGDDDLFFQINSNHFRLYDSEADPPPIYRDSSRRDEPELGLDGADTEEQRVAEFAYERDLQNFLSKNPHLLEPGLCLYEDEGITGVEFPAGGRFIDILAVDRDGHFVVVELKVSRGYDRVIGQLLRYMGWVAENMADLGQKVRGFIVAREISEDLILACRNLPNVELFEYELSVSIRKVHPQVDNS